MKSWLRARSCIDHITLRAGGKPEAESFDECPARGYDFAVNRNLNLLLSNALLLCGAAVGF